MLLVATTPAIEQEGQPSDLPEESHGDRLAALRRARGLTQSELAERVQLTQTLVSDYERGRLRLNADVIVRFANALEVTSDQLLGLATTAEDSPLPRKFLRRLKLVLKLPKRDQDALLRTLDAFINARAD